MSYDFITVATDGEILTACHQVMLSLEKDDALALELARICSLFDHHNLARGIKDFCQESEKAKKAFDWAIGEMRLARLREIESQLMRTNSSINTNSRDSSFYVRRFIEIKKTPRFYTRPKKYRII